MSDPYRESTEVPRESTPPDPGVNAAKRKMRVRSLPDRGTEILIRGVKGRHFGAVGGMADAT